MSQLQKQKLSQKKLNSSIFDDANVDSRSEPLNGLTLDDTPPEAQSSWLVQSSVSDLKAELNEVKEQMADMITRTNSFIKNQLDLNSKMQKQDEVLNHRDLKIVENFNEQMKSLGARVGPLFDQEDRTRELISHQLSVLNKMENRMTKQESALIERDAQINFLQSLIREMQRQITKKN